MNAPRSKFITHPPPAHTPFVPRTCKNGMSRTSVCRNLLLPKFGGASDTEWPQLDVESLVEIQIHHQQMTPHQQWMWILLGDDLVRHPSCPPMSPPASIVKFVEQIANHQGGPVDLMFENYDGSMSPGESWSIPMTGFNATSLPPCQKQIVSVHIARLIANIATENGSSILSALTNFVNCGDVPVDHLTNRRIRRLDHILMCINDYDQTLVGVKRLAEKFMLVLKDMMPVAAYVTPLMQSYLCSIDEPHKCRILYAFRALMWGRHRNCDTQNMCRIFHDTFVTRTLVTSDLLTGIRSRLCELMLDMQVICHSFSLWNGGRICQRDSGARVAVLFAGRSHIKNIGQVLIAISPSDMLYHAPGSQQHTASNAEQNPCLNSRHVCGVSAESIGSLRHHSKNNTMTHVPMT